MIKAKGLVGAGGLLILASALLAGCSGEANIFAQNETASERGREVLVVGAGDVVQLTVQSGVGQVEVRPGVSGEEVVIEYVKTAYATQQANAEQELAEMALLIEGDGSRVVIDSRQPARAGDSVTNKVDLVIAVPGMVTLDLTSNVGDIRLTDVAVAEPLQLRSNVGDIIGQGVAATDGGEMSVKVGDIRFEGAVGAAPATFAADVGTILLELPPDTAADLAAEVKIGSLIIGGFELGAEVPTKTTTGATFDGALGEGGPAITVNTNVGDVTLRATGD